MSRPIRACRRLFFTWALKADKRVHYEFLDNSVTGAAPRTMAFGVNGVMTILDLKSLLDVDRYRKINVDATGPRRSIPMRADGAGAQHRFPAPMRPPDGDDPLRRA